MHIQGQPGFLPLDPRQGTRVCTSVCLPVWECELWGRHIQGSLAPRPRASTHVCGSLRTCLLMGQEAPGHLVGPIR